MPELPEVENVKRTLADKIIGKEISGLTINYEGNIRQPAVKVFRKLLLGKVFKKISRRGKFLLFYLSAELVLVVHLRMTGQLFYAESKEPTEKHTHLIFHLEDEHELRYVDLRKFGTFDLIPAEKLASFKSLKQLGIEPLSPEFTFSWLQAHLKNKKQPVKNFLLDQKNIAGIGNIYADEILFRGGIHPKASCKRLETSKIKKLHREIIQVLKLAIRYRGTSIRDYVDGDGQQGEFQNLLQVYGKREEPCPYCGEPIVRIRLAGRGTHYCPNCQQK